MADEVVEDTDTDRDTDDSCSVTELPTLSSDSTSSSSLALCADLRPLCTDRLGMVNCGMLPGVRMLGKTVSLLVCESDPREQPKDFALLVAQRSARMPALLCLRAVEKSSESLLLLLIVPMLNVRVTVSLSMFLRVVLSAPEACEVKTDLRRLLYIVTHVGLRQTQQLIRKCDASQCRK